MISLSHLSSSFTVLTASLVYCLRYVLYRWANAGDISYIMVVNRHLFLPCYPGNLQSLMDEKKALELHVDNLSGQLQHSKTQLTDVDSRCQQLQVR